MGYRRFLLAAASLGTLGAASGALAAAVVDPVMAMAAAEVAPVNVMGRRDARRTITATKTDTPLSEVPQAIGVVSAELIRDQSMQSMADVVRYVPGVSMGQGEGHRDAPTLRGNATTADFFVDGVRDDAQYFRDLYNAERVEVLKGPNAMIFGRGGGGGVINRVTRQADWSSGREVVLEAGAWDHRRLTADLNRPLGDAVSGRLTAMVQDSGSYRDHVGLERWAVNPTLTWRASDQLSLRLAYERFEDERTVDRGLPSFMGRPSPAPVERFFGDPARSHAEAQVDLLSARLEYEPRNGMIVRNHTVVAAYDKFYQNVFAGGPAAGAAGVAATVPLQGYNDATERRNLFNQTDLVWGLETGPLSHTLLVGVEFGRQETDSLRRTAFFNNTATTLTVPFGSPTLSGYPITFRPSATDPERRVEASVAAAYVQDQVEIGERWQVIAGLRYDVFDLDFHDRRTGQRLGRRDELLSPRLGVVFQPVAEVSLYASYSVSHLPSSGDQFAALTPTTRTFEPEGFENVEVGAKWEPRPDLLVTAAAYRLDRTNTTARDPSNPAVTVLTGAQRSEGLEVGISGRLSERWEIAGGYGWQDARIIRATAAASAGRAVPLTPRHTVSLWNKVTLSSRWAIGLGVIAQAKMFAAIDNAVTLPGFTRLDAAVFYRLSERVGLQVNVENLADATYFPTSHGNNNILPGSPRAVRASLTARF